jgi:hypothetical protein
MGVIVTGFCAAGSFERGAKSTRRRAWSAELSARSRAIVARRSSVGGVQQSLTGGALPTATWSSGSAAVSSQVGSLAAS